MKRSRRQGPPMILNMSERLACSMTKDACSRSEMFVRESLDFYSSAGIIISNFKIRFGIRERGGNGSIFLTQSCCDAKETHTIRCGDGFKNPANYGGGESKGWGWKDNHSC